MLLIKFTNEIALITAVSDLKMFFESVKGVMLEVWSINALSEGEKSPSGPINTEKYFTSLEVSFFKLSLELTSANNNLVELSRLFKKSPSFITLEISGGFNWLDCLVASTTIFFALS